MPHELSIVIVSYNCAELLLKCLQSIHRQVTDFSYEIIIVDNSSTDHSEVAVKTDFPKVNWMSSGYNAGFARANNTGIRASTNRLILILNPDTEMPAGFLQKYVSCYKEMDETCNLGISGCRIISSEDASLLIGSGIEFPSFKRTLFANPVIIRLARMLKISLERKYDAHKMHGSDHPVDFVSGACAMISKNKIEKHGLYFDEDFFLYYEDVEWSYRTKKLGYTNYFFSSVTIYHENSATTKKSGNKENQILISSFLFYYKTMNLLCYYIHGALMSINFLIISFLLKRAGHHANHQDKLKQYKIFRNYYFSIPYTFKRNPSSSKTFLQYVEPT
ncbi:MAG: glycosyltransferase family 2 protein [Bacteroidetes bacterium]|nr:glycosyltransferase family 2 protein [Bacteroidota bacterium]